MASSVSSATRPRRGASRSSKAGPPADVLFGSEIPRVWTPPLRPLTPETSAGFACIEFAEEVLRIPLLPWQRWLLIHALELLPDGTYRFRTVVLLVSRQNGKSLVLQVLSLWRMYVTGAPLVIGTAQNLDVAEEQWQGAVDLAQGVEELADEIADVVKVNGKKALILTSKERYKVAAASRRGGRGLSGDLILLDELREHQKWDAWGAVTKTTMARPRAQVWAASNAGDLSSVVLGFLRLAAHAALGNPDQLELGELQQNAERAGAAAESLGIFEWSAPPGCDLWDRGGWAQANPSLGFEVVDPITGEPAGLTERALAAAAATDPENVFRTECLCQWVDQLTERVVPEDAWRNCERVDHKPTGRLRYALEVDQNAKGETWASIGYSDGTHLQVATPVPGEQFEHLDIVYGPGTGWVVPALVAMKDVVGEVVIAKDGPAWPLADDIRAAGVAVREMTTDEFVQASMEGKDAVVQGLVRHLDQPQLNAAVAGAKVVDVGDGKFRFSRKQSAQDIGPWNAVLMARWAAVNAPTAAVPLVAWR